MSDDFRLLQMPAELNTCRVCGLRYDDFLPWGDDGKTASFEMCICCGVEFGYEDGSPESARDFRQLWIDAGCQWSSKSQQPANWNLDDQLANIPHRFR
jgi:hypothetical protein